MAVFSKTFWVQTAELVLVAFASTFASSLTLTSGTPTWHGVAAAGLAAGIAALYAFVTQLKSVQAVNSVAAGKPSAVAK